jgi:catechol 2,3-dioxygenase-like lactoylglutathione lyase family enzyme
MIDHLGLYCRDSNKSLPFYRACLEPLGIGIDEEQPELRAAIFMRAGSSFFWWLGEGDEDTRAQAGRSRIHLAFIAMEPGQVDQFYAAAIANGGVDNGPPAIRQSACYSAFVIDPDGNNVEAICRR